MLTRPCDMGTQGGTRRASLSYPDRADSIRGAGEHDPVKCPRPADAATARARRGPGRGARPGPAPSRLRRSDGAGARDSAGLDPRVRPSTAAARPGRLRRHPGTGRRAAANGRPARRAPGRVPASPECDPAGRRPLPRPASPGRPPRRRGAATRRRRLAPPGLAAPGRHAAARRASQACHSPIPAAEGGQVEQAGPVTNAPAVIEVRREMEGHGPILPPRRPAGQGARQPRRDRDDVRGETVAIATVAAPAGRAGAYRAITPGVSAETSGHAGKPLYTGPAQPAPWRP